MARRKLPSSANSCAPVIRENEEGRRRNEEMVPRENASLVSSFLIPPPAFRCCGCRAAARTWEAHTCTSRFAPGNRICSGCGRPCAGQSTALATAARICANHHCARVTRVSRRRPKMRACVPLNPSSSCWLVVIMFIVLVAITTPLSQEGLDKGCPRQNFWKLSDWTRNGTSWRCVSSKGKPAATARCRRRPASRQPGNFQVVEKCPVEARSQTNQAAVDGSTRAQRANAFKRPVGGIAVKVDDRFPGGQMTVRQPGKKYEQSDLEFYPRLTR